MLWLNEEAHLIKLSPWQGMHQSARTIPNTTDTWISLERYWLRGIVSKCYPVDISTSALPMGESSKHGTKTVRLEKWNHISSQTFF